MSIFKTKNIICILLVMSIMGPGLPFIGPLDLNRDLKDTILFVKVFVNTSEKPVNFESALKEMIDSLTIAAGLKTVIKPKHKKRHSLTYQNENPFCRVFFGYLFNDDIIFYSQQPLPAFCTVTVIPETPPPKIC